jgi:hypothetical protein
MASPAQKTPFSPRPNRARPRQDRRGKDRAYRQRQKLSEIVWKISGIENLVAEYLISTGGH